MKLLTTSSTWSDARAWFIGSAPLGVFESVSFILKSMFLYKEDYKTGLDCFKGALKDLLITGSMKELF